MTISKELLDELLSGVENADDLLGDKGLMKQLKVRLMERMLGAELTAHLGYEPHGVNGRVKVSQWAAQNVATLGFARLPGRRAPASGRPRLSQSWRLPGCFGP
jgi:hypothetical protein